MTQRAFQPDHSDAPEGYHDPDRNITLLLRDCLTGMREFLIPGSVDVIVTSPPYNIAKVYGPHYNDAIPRHQYLDWIEAWGQEASSVLADQGSLFLNIAGTPSSPHGPHEVLDRLLTYFELQNTIHVITSIVIDAALVKRPCDHCGHRNAHPLALGHYTPTTGNRFLHSCHQYVFHLTKHGTVPLDRLAIGTTYADPTNATRWGNGDRNQRRGGNIWFVPHPTIQSRDRDRPHPAPFPIDLPRRCIQLHGVTRTSLVIDPFCGSGTSAVACQQLGVSFVGFETGKPFFDYAVERLRQHDADTQPSLFDGN